jgi:hypothetical protein
MTECNELPQDTSNSAAEYYGTPKLKEQKNM